MPREGNPALGQVRCHKAGLQEDHRDSRASWVKEVAMGMMA